MTKNKILEKKYIDIIMNYLRFKRNYIYFSNTSFEHAVQVSSQNNKLLEESRLNYNDLSASSYYSIKKVNNEYNDITLKYPKRNTSFLKFNDFEIQNLLGESYIFSFSRYFDKNNDKEVNIGLLRNLMMSIFKRIDNKKVKYIIDIQKVISDIFPSCEREFSQLINDIIDNYDDSMDELIDIKNKIQDEYKKLNSKINEIGIFYPAYLYPNYYKNNTHLVEINSFKNQKSKEKILQEVEKFYSMFENEIFPTNNNINYLKNNSDTFDDAISYFDPFILLKKDLYNDFVFFCNKFSNSKYNINDFINILNQLQFELITIQQRNLMNDLMIFKSKDKEHFKKLSIKEFLKETIELQKKCHNQNDPKMAERILILQLLLDDFHISKSSNIILDDFPVFKNWSKQDRKSANNILQKILIGLNKNKEYSLEGLFNRFYQIFIIKLNEKNIKVCKHTKIFLEKIIKYILTNKTDGKISKTKYYNEYFYEIYIYNIKRNKLLKNYMNSIIIDASQ